VANGDDVNIDDSTINSKYYVSKDADGFVIRIGNNSFVSKNTAERLFSFPGLPLFGLKVYLPIQLDNTSILLQR